MKPLELLGSKDPDADLPMMDGDDGAEGDDDGEDGTRTRRGAPSSDGLEDDDELGSDEEEDEREEDTLADVFIDAAQLGHIVEVERLLKKGEVDPDARQGETRNTALILAAQNGRSMCVDALIAAGADVNAANKNGDTPLLLASLNGHGRVVDSLLKAGANVHAVDKFGSRALFYASRQGHCGLVDALIKAGAEVDWGNSKKFNVGSRVSALLIASRFGHASAVRRLLKAGADVDAVDTGGNTAIHRCALETTPGAVYGGTTGEALVMNCASLDAVNKDGMKAIQLARKGIAEGTSEWQRQRCREVVEVLELAQHMTVGLRRWLLEVGLENQWREFARLGAKEKEDIEMLERDDVRRDKGSSLTPIEANRLFRAIALPEPMDMGIRFEGFMEMQRLEEYVPHFRMLGVAFERDLLDVTHAQLDLMVERHGLKILDRRRFDKAVVGLRRRLMVQEDDQDSEERHPIRMKKEDGSAGSAPHRGIIKNVSFAHDLP